MKFQFELFLIMLLLSWSHLATAQTSFLNFESGPVRPLALSPNGSRLFVVNTPDNTLEIFDVGASGLNWTAAVAVGMEPVAVAARTNGEVWVVNHLSDSVSVIDLTGANPVVSRTLLVGDEPRDIVFAGAGGRRAFISSARRGQHRTHASIAGAFGEGESADPLLFGVSDQADVWVFDSLNLGSTLGGTPVRVLTFFFGYAAGPRQRRPNRLRSGLPIGQPNHRGSRRKCAGRVRQRGTNVLGTGRTSGTRPQRIRRSRA